MFTYPQIDPVIFSLGFVDIRWYSLSYIFGFFLIYQLCYYREKKYNLLGINKQVLLDFCFNILLFSIIGGRLGHVFFYDFERFLADPLWLFKVWQGGMSFHGALIGFLLTIYWFARKKSLNYFQVSDTLAINAGIGLFFGRIANFINGELWGKPTDSFLGMVFPHVDKLPRHPSQLYEAFSEGLLALVILWLISLSKPRRGILSGGFLIIYGCSRFLIEFVREPEAYLGYIYSDWFTRGQLLSIPMIMFGLGIIFYYIKNPVWDYNQMSTNIKPTKTHLTVQPKPKKKKYKNKKK